jgi:hypothetical protein
MKAIVVRRFRSPEVLGIEELADRVLSQTRPSSKSASPESTS